MKYSNGKIITWSKSAAVLLTLLVFVAGFNAVNAAPNSPNPSNNSGKKCTVTSGPNKGESGTYSSDGWCEGDWGGTECKGNNGESKCKNVESRIPQRTPGRAPSPGVMK